MHDAPELLLIDALILAYRQGLVRHKEQLHSIHAASLAATDVFTALTAIENFGIGKGSRLYQFIAQFLAAPDYYRKANAHLLLLHDEGKQAESFLNNPKVVNLMEPILEKKQWESFYNAYWWFVKNHSAVFISPKEESANGIYASEPTDNESALQRFETYLYGLQNNKKKSVRERYETMPVRTMIILLKRSFL